MTDAAPHAPRAYKYYALVMAGFVTVLLCSNLIGPGKTCLITIPFLNWNFAIGAGNLFFPIGYIFGDILTEVYGYARARKVIWAGFVAMLFANFMIFVVLNMPADPANTYNQTIDPALQTVFGNAWRVTLGSLLAFWVGDFANSYVLAKMKILTRGKYLWTRTIGSTVVGQLVDSAIFYPIAFGHLWTSSTLLGIVLVNFAIKLGVEVVFTPVTYLVVNRLKRAENEDYYDTQTNFTPFSLKD